MKDFGSLWSHAIDAPVSLAMSVANGDGETAKIATNHLDGAVKAGSVTIDARNGHVFPFASIVGFIQRSVGATTCKEKMEIKAFCAHKVAVSQESRHHH